MRTPYFLTSALLLTSLTAASAAHDVPMSGTNLGSVTGGKFKMALSIIEKRCTTCHSASVINAAIAQHKDMAAIQKQMEKKGARLSRNEREVLGIYWKQQPLKRKEEKIKSEENLPHGAAPAH